MEKPRLQFTDSILRATVLKLIPVWVRPNWFTAARLIATPFVVWLVLAERFGAAVALFLLAAFTDLLDGAMARTRSQITNLGKILDPVADKLLIGSLMVTMTWVYLSAPLAAVIVAIELLFLAGGLYRLRKGIVPQANLWGKIKFNFQVLGVIFLFLSVLAVDPLPWERIAFGSFLAAIVFAILSLVTQGF